MLTDRTISKYKNAVLGRRFELSFSTATPAKMKKLNTAYRHIAKATDILSFPLSKTSGEIVICMNEVKSHAKAFGMTPEKYLPYLVIHGMIHLKGHDHGRIMDELEKKFCRRLRITMPEGALTHHGRTHRSRH